jgi:hypothetical protein
MYINIDNANINGASKERIMKDRFRTLVENSR